MERTLEEIDEILYEATINELFLEIILMRGLGLSYQGMHHTVRITYPKMEFGMQPLKIVARMDEKGPEDSWWDRLKGNETMHFKTDNDSSLYLEHSEIESCKVLPYLLYPDLYRD